MVLKTLGKTTWEEIEVGEVFACAGCWQIHCKISRHDSFFLADDYTNGKYLKQTSQWYPGLKKKRVMFVSINECPLYKLPKSTQRLWRED